VERATIVLNPAARNAPSAGRLRVAALGLRPAGWEIDLVITEAAGHATELARSAAAAGSKAVFACGGDGTINEVVNGLVGTESALAVIRGGMGDVFGKEIDVARAPEKALRVLTEGDRRRFDLGLATMGEPTSTQSAGARADSARRYFLLMAGVGFDAAIVRRVPLGPKRLIGSAAYGVWGALELAQYRPRRTQLAFDGEEREAELYWLLLGNTRSYGGVLNITSEAKVDDGLLNARLFTGGGLPWVASTAARIVSGRADGGGGVWSGRVREAAIVTPGIDVQADGEYLGQTPVRFQAAPGALSVLLPRGRGRELFSNQAEG
jgi:YegS/Rv2252/BmrU family lipid kinase